MAVVAGEHILVFSVIVHGKLLFAEELLVTIFIAFDRWRWYGGRGGEHPAVINLVLHAVMPFQHSMGSSCVVTLDAPKGFLFLCFFCVL